MAHGLAFRANRAQMAYTGNVPWHGLGQRLTENAGIDTWVREAGMDYQILRAPVFFREEEHGQAIEIPSRHVLYRSDTRQWLGILSDDYQIVQPASVLEFFRDLTEEAGFKMETAGVLFDGRKYWALARVAADAFVEDERDRISPYLLLATSADGSMATEARLTTVRVVCNNTLRAANAAAAKVRVTHRQAFDHGVAKGQLGISKHQAAASFAETMDVFRSLARAPLGGVDMVKLTLQAFGHKPEKLDREQLQKAAESRGVQMVGTAASTGRGLVGRGLQGAGENTAWGWLNAVTQYADHAAKARSPSHRLDSAWFGAGERLKSRALELAMEYVGSSSAPVTRYEEAPSDGGLLDDVLAATMEKAA